MLSHPVNAASVSKLLDKLTLLVEKRDYLLLDSNLSALNVTSNDDRTKNKKHFQYQDEQLQVKVDRLKNSCSWKITTSLRIF